MSRGVGQQHGGVAVDVGENVADDDAAEFVDVARLRQFAAQRVQLVRAPFACARHRRLALAARGEMADHETGREHHAEGDQVLRVGYGERIDRRHEQKIEQHHGQDRGERRRPAADARGDVDGAEQVEHDQVGQLDVREQQFAEQRDRGDDGDAARVGRPRARAPRRPWRWRRLLAGFARDYVDVDCTAAARDFVDERGLEPVPPARTAGLADDDLADVAPARIGEQFGRDRLAGQVRRFRTERLGELQRRQHAVARGARQTRERRRFHVDRNPARVQRRRQAPRCAHEAF